MTNDPLFDTLFMMAALLAIFIIAGIAATFVDRYLTLRSIRRAHAILQAAAQESRRHV